MINGDLQMSEYFWQQKIIAFLHDPPQKALLLGKGIGHERVAHDLIKAALGDAGDSIAWKNAKKNAKTADRIASAADRINFPEGTQLTWWKRPLLRHPLSGSKFNLRDLGTLDIEEVNNHVNKKVAKLQAECKGDAEKIFLSLWRCLSEELKTDETISKNQPEERLGATWDLLPADTRMPQHTIWQHNRTVSALATAIPNPSLLVMSIGPVQGYISCARKMSDFWAGSWILSYLSWEGMKAIGDRYGPDVILYPDLRGQPLVDHWLRNEKKIPGIPEPDGKLLGTPSLPNRWLSVLPADVIQDVAQSAEEAIRKSMKKISETIQNHFDNKVKIDKKQWERQGDWLEIYWSAHDWPNVDKWPNDDKPMPDDFAATLDELLGPDDNFNRMLNAIERSRKYNLNLGDYYGRLCKLVDRAHGSRKLLRNFNSHEREPGYKCTLCGEREPALLNQYNSANYTESKKAWRLIKENVVLEEGDVKEEGRERLCTVCLTKRLAPRYYFADQFGIEKGFPSTSEIAATTFKIAVLKKAAESQELHRALSNLINAIASTGEIPRNASYVPAIGTLLGNPDSIDSKAEWREFAKLDGEWWFEETYEHEEHRDAFKALSGFFKVTEKEGIRKPSPYYAIAFLDGDEMGKWVSGNHEDFPIIEDQIHTDVIPKCRDAFGDKLLKQRSPQAPALHSAMSASLLGFALHIARYIVEKKHSGKLIYAGGDDVFAMAPIAEVLNMIDDLQESFHSPAWISGDGKKVVLNREALEKIRSGSGGNSVFLGMGNATASAGIAIAHYQTPLSQVIEAAREMEKRAKEFLGRDAFSVAILKRSGEKNQTGAKWHFKHNQPENARTISVLQAMIKKFSDPDGLSRRILNDLREEKHGLCYLPPEAWESRLRYLLERRGDKAESEKTAGAIRALFEHYMSILADGPEGEELDRVIHAWDETVNLLALAAFIARHSRNLV